MAASWRGPAATPSRYDASSPLICATTGSPSTLVAVLFLLWLAFLPGINNLGQVLVIVLLAVLAVVGIELLRRQTAQEFPPAADSS